jgi:hypothetical protein
VSFSQNAQMTNKLDITSLINSADQRTPAVSVAHISGDAIWPWSALGSADKLRWLLFLAQHISPSAVGLPFNWLGAPAVGLTPDEGAIVCCQKCRPTSSESSKVSSRMVDGVPGPRHHTDRSLLSSDIQGDREGALQLVDGYEPADFRTISRCILSWQ